MSRHPSFGKEHRGATKRNVLKRYERIDMMKKVGKWEDLKKKRVTGLPKTRVDI